MGIREGKSLSTIAWVGFTKQITNQTKSVGLEEAEEVEVGLQTTGTTFINEMSFMRGTIEMPLRYNSKKF